jgi:hypothetical protein
MARENVPNACQGPARSLYTAAKIDVREGVTSQNAVDQLGQGCARRADQGDLIPEKRNAPVRTSSDRRGGASLKVTFAVNSATFT